MTPFTEAEVIEYDLQDVIPTDDEIEQMLDEASIGRIVAGSVNPTGSSPSTMGGACTGQTCPCAFSGSPTMPC